MCVAFDKSDFCRASWVGKGGNQRGRVDRVV